MKKEELKQLIAEDPTYRRATQMEAGNARSSLRSLQISLLRLKTEALSLNFSSLGFYQNFRRQVWMF